MSGSGISTSTLGVTQSSCATCRQIVPAKIAVDPSGVWLDKHCPVHGRSRVRVWNDARSYLDALRVTKPALAPRAVNGDVTAECPKGCGLCERHEQHLCLPVIEITRRCDLRCPICLVDAGDGSDMTVEEFGAIVDRLVEAEGTIRLVNLSGGEPLLHPRLLEMVDNLLARQGVVRVSISTNGLQLLDNAELVTQLARRNVVISLQLDGFSDDAYCAMRGRPLADAKHRILSLLREADIPTSLVMTVAGGVNDDHFGPVLDLLFSRDHIVSLMVQPLCFAGRAAAMDSASLRLTIPDIVERLGAAGHPAVSARDFAPLPCSHALCFSLAFYVMHGDRRATPLVKLVDVNRILDSTTNRLFFGLAEDEHGRLKDMVYDLWSGPTAAAPDTRSALDTVRGILLAASTPGSPFDARRAFTTAERRLKSIFIHAFQDAETFDLSRARRCCTAYPLAPDRVVPACVRNVFMNNASARGDDRQPS